MRTTSVILISLFLSLSVAQADITTGLKAYYNFEGLSGSVGETIADQTGNGHDGVCRQDQATLKAPTIVEGPSGLGEALDFDGNFYVQIPNHADFDVTAAITVAAWISVDDWINDWQTVFCRGDWSWRLHRRSTTDFLTLGLTGDNIAIHGETTNLRIPKRWLHLVGVWQQGAGGTLYINGAVEASHTNGSGTINTSGSDPVTIGAQINIGSLQRQWYGQIDEVRLYNRALSPSDVTELYQFTHVSNWNAKPSVTLPASQSLTLPDQIEFTLTGTVADDGNPLPENPSSPNPSDPNKLSWWWEIVTKPNGAPDPAFIADDPDDLGGSAFVYNNPNQPIAVDPNVKFSEVGMYELRLHASDGEKENEQTIAVVVSPSGSSANGYLYLSPVPGAEYTSPSTRFILVRFEEVTPYDITNLSSFITVSGSSSGNHPGQTKIASDNRTVIFTMSSNFHNDEEVTVALTPNVAQGAAGTVDPYQYQFYITRSATSPAPPQTTNSESVSTIDSAADLDREAQGDIPIEAASAGITMPNGISVPSNFPQINITINDNSDSGYIFLDNRRSGSNSYNVIFDNNGSPIWYLQANDERRDMKVQQNGVLTMLNRTSGLFFWGLDTHYEEIATYRAVNGYSTDEHELVVLAEGAFLLIGLRNNTVDMSQYVPGGRTSANVRETVIQEFTPEGDLIFQWRAWDNFDIADLHLDSPTSGNMRFPHMNAIDIDEDGHLLLSSRHLSEITKINRDTGDIIWRLSGIPKNNDFTFVNDNFNPKGPFNQHAIRHTGNGRYLMFDNGDLHSPQRSRGVEYELDLNAMTATVVFQYPETPTSGLYSHYMGNTQRLPNGNTLINWAIGSLPKLTEVRPDGTKAFEMNWAEGREAYRVWRCPWQGMALKPNLIIEPQTDNITLIFNKFGDPDVDYYNIYSGVSANPTTVLATSDVTLAELTVGLAPDTRNYFRVTAVDYQGQESAFSNEVSAVVNFFVPGAEMVKNGDFSQGTTDPWGLYVDPSASATLDVVNEEGHVAVTTGGSFYWQVQLWQAGMRLTQGETYILEYDARCTGAPRQIEPVVGQNSANGTNYSLIQSFFITPNPIHKRHEFRMNNPTDNNARVAFNVGITPGSNIYIDNVSLKMNVEELCDILPGDLNFDCYVNLSDLYIVIQNWLTCHNLNDPSCWE